MLSGLADCKPQSAGNDSMPSADSTGTLSSMNKRTEKDVGDRLRVLQAELGFATTRAFGDYLGAERGTLDAWLNGRAFPPVRYLLRLVDEHAITLDWIFTGDPSGLSYARGIRLQAAVENETVPPAEDGEREVGLVVQPQSVVARRRRRKTKAAT